MKPSIAHKRIPTLFGLLLLTGLIFGTSMLVKSGILFPTKATDTDQPKAIQTTNITDTSFTVSYITDNPVVGSVTYGETETYGTVELDERDKTGNTALPHTIHSVTITHLKPKTKYSYAIISGSTTYTDNGKPYTITTAATLTAPSDNQQPLTGTLGKPDGGTPTEAIVYVSAPGSQVVSTLAKPDGSFSVNLNTLMDAQLSAYIQPDQQTILRLNIMGDGLMSSVKATPDKSNPLPPVTLSQDYDFTLSTTEESTAAASSSASTANIGFPKFSGNKPVNTNPQILSPQKDEEYNDRQPEFSGTAPPGRTVEIVIHSTQEIRATVHTDKFGSWSYRPTRPLTPGTHTIQITTKDEAGLTRTILQSFVVNAEGSQFTEPSVSPVKPSAKPTPTPSPSPRPTATPTQVPTKAVPPTSGPTTNVSPTPTTVPTATPTEVPTPTTYPTLTPFPTQFIPPTQNMKPTISDTGSNEVIATVSIAAIAMISGAVLFFLSQGIM